MTALVHGYLSETTRLLRAMGVAGAMPVTARRVLLNTTIASLQSTGIWTKLDALWVLAANAQGSALINWRNPGTHDLTPVNGITFAADVGFTGDAVSMHLTIGSPSFAQFALNSATMWANVSGGTGVDAVIAPTTSGGSAWLFPYNGTSMTSRLNTTTTATVGASVNRTGRFLATRNDAVNITGYKNGAAIATVASASIAVNTTSLALLRRSTIYANDRIRDAGFGSGFSAADAANLETILNTYHAGL